MAEIKVDSFLYFLFDILMRHTKSMKINGHGMDTVFHMDPEDWT